MVEKKLAPGYFSKFFGKLVYPSKSLKVFVDSGDVTEVPPGH